VRINEVRCDRCRKTLDKYIVVSAYTAPPEPLKETWDNELWPVLLRGRLGLGEGGETVVSDFSKGGWTILKDDEGVEYRVPTVVMRERDRKMLDSAIDRLLDAVTQRNHYADDGIEIKDEYDCCGCAAYMEIVRASIKAVRGPEIGLST
jgi:ribosomal protein S26